MSPPSKKDSQKYGDFLKTGRIDWDENWDTTLLAKQGLATPDYVTVESGTGMKPGPILLHYSDSEKKKKPCKELEILNQGNPETTSV